MKRKMPQAGPGSVGQRLRAARAELELTQADMARAVGVTQSSIAAYEADQRRPPLPVALALEHVFRLNHPWLLEGEGQRLAAARPARPAIVTSPRELRELERREGTDRYHAVLLFPELDYFSAFPDIGRQRLLDHNRHFIFDKSLCQLQMVYGGSRYRYCVDLAQ